MDAVACLDDRETQRLDAAEQMSQIRIERILAVREQIAQGSYSIDERLDAVLDRILEDLLQR